jgi:TetR/AcrR family transcriptional repressor of nem operon
MRYRPGHKAETHKKIVEDASQRVRAEGLDKAGISAVMRDTGLTHGGFYKHFPSKDDLLVESVTRAFEDMSGRLIKVAEQSPRGTAWKAIVKEYLSQDHCDHPERGCPLASVAPELARTDKDLKKRFGASMVEYKAQLIPFMPGRRTVDKERAFFAIFSTMIGAVEIARMIPDRHARERVLTGTRNFLLKSFRSRASRRNRLRPAP